jgi:iron complex transport system ATP-binding protein
VSTRDPILQATSIHVDIEGKRIVDGVDINVGAGEIVGLIGPNGAGKTTLLRALAGVLSPQRGDIFVNGLDAALFDRSHLATKVAYLEQGAQVHWPLSVASIVALGRLPYRRKFSSLARDDRRAIESALQRTETLSLAERSFETLSGGERMRVLIARLLAVEAEVMLVDEPVAAMDPYFQLEFMDLFVEQAALGRGLVLVLHDLALAARYCDRLVLLEAGRTIAVGPPAEVLTDELLAQVYNIDTVTGSFEDQSYVIPWRRKLK